MSRAGDFTKGRKKRAKGLPNRSTKRSEKWWQDYAAKVRSTHSMTRDGAPQIDPRDDKYLHSHARAMRPLQRLFA